MKNASLATILYILIALGTISCKNEIKVLEAKNGRLYLENYEFISDDGLFLIGDWEFYWNRILYSKDFVHSESDTLPNYLRVPGRWNKFQINNKELGSNGFATYRLVIKLSQKHKTLALSLPSQATAFDLYVNGLKIANTGIVGTNKNKSKPAFGKKIAVINADTSQLEFIVHVSNFHHIDGGFWHSFLLNKQEYLLPQIRKDTEVGIFIIGSIFIIALFHFALFVSRPKNLSALYFAFLSMFITIRSGISLNHSEVLFFNFSWQISMFLEMFTFLAAIPSFVLYFKSIFNSIIPKWVMHAVLIVFAIQTIFLIAFSAQVYLQAILIFEIWLIIILVYITVKLFIAMFLKLEFSVYFFVAYFALAISVIADVLTQNSIFHPIYSIHLGLFLFTFFQSFLLAKKFTLAFVQSEKLTIELSYINNNLEALVDSRTSEIELQKKQIHLSAEKLQISYNKLKEMEHFKEGMMSMIVHDLKNPLNIILNHSKTESTEKQLEIVRRTSRQMQNLVMNILDIQKYENTIIPVDKSDILLKYLVIDVLKEVEFLYRDKNIIPIIVMPDDISVFSDREITERIFINLLTNAIKYSPYNCNIQICANLFENDYIKISIKDKGIGIAKEKLHMIFEKFGQVNARNSGSMKSTGLGLSFCKLAVESLGGEIGVISQPNEGAIFWFTLKTLKAINEVSPISENELYKPKKTMVFIEQEKQFLMPYVNRLFEFSVYETDDVQIIMNTIYTSKNNNISDWKLEMQDAIRSLNQAKYFELLKLILD